MNTSYHEIDGLRVRVAQASSNKAMTLLMTNALPQSIMCWESLWDRLAQSFDLLAVDMPGFGLSEGTDALMRPGAQATFLRKVLDHFGIEKVFGVGPDVGVPVLLSFASQYPERLLGLNLYDGPGTWPPDFDPSLKLAATSSLARRVVTGWPMRRVFMKGNYKTATALGYHTFQPSEAAEQEYREICFDRRKHDNAIAFLGSYPQALPEIEAALPKISTPVLLTWGAHDQFVPPSNGQKMHAQLPNSELTIFEEAGHFSHEDADQQWLETLVGFIEKRGLPHRSAD